MAPTPVWVQCSAGGQMGPSHAEPRVAPAVPFQYENALFGRCLGGADRGFAQILMIGASGLLGAVAQSRNGNCRCT